VEKIEEYGKFLIHRPDAQRVIQSHSYDIVTHKCKIEIKDALKIINISKDNSCAHETFNSSFN